jgi:hypothetical protein
MIQKLRKSIKWASFNDKHPLYRILFTIFTICVINPSQLEIYADGNDDYDHVHCNEKPSAQKMKNNWSSSYCRGSDNQAAKLFQQIRSKEIRQKTKGMSQV